MTRKAEEEGARKATADRVARMQEEMRNGRRKRPIV
jgi:hypothetical protein